MTRTTSRALLESTHVAALAIWLGAAGMSGLFAATVFPKMKELDPKLPAYSAYEGDHWSLAAGQLANQVFIRADVAQFLGALAAGITLAILIARRHITPRWKSTWVRGVALGFGMACVAGLIIFVQPAMQASFKAYWAAAEAGNTQAALNARAAADQLHPWAARLIAGGTFCSLIALLAAGWGLGRAAALGGAEARAEGRPA